MMLAKPSNTNAMPSPPKGYEVEQRKYQAEDALRDLERAEKHKSDPKLMGDVEKCRQDKMRSLAAIKVEIAPKTFKMKK